MYVENPNPAHRIALFQKMEIRRTLHNGEWWFVISDVIAALTDSVNPPDYLKKLLRRECAPLPSGMNSRTSGISAVCGNRRNTPRPSILPSLHI